MLKTPLLQKLPLSKDSSFIYERYESPNFETPWHFHEEIEIAIMEKGYGKKIVGNHTSEYHEGDVFLLGSNLPHWFRADNIFYKTDSEIKPSSLVIQFNVGSFGQTFFKLIEMEKVNDLFQKARAGILFYGNTKNEIRRIFDENFNNVGLKRMLGLIEMLHIMANSEEYTQLSKLGIVGISAKDSERMQVIFDYIYNKYTEDIDLNELASKVGLSSAAFCRYFKSRTQKTFIEYLNEIKISNACRLLKETDHSIIEICYETGFNNLSNFNRQFRKITDQNPNNYRKAVSKGW